MKPPQIIHCKRRDLPRVPMIEVENICRGQVTLIICLEGGGWFEIKYGQRAAIPRSDLAASPGLDVAIENLELAGHLRRYDPA